MFAPLLATMQAEGVLNRVARFVAEQPQAIGPVATLDLEDLRALDYATPGGSMVATAQDVGVFLRALNDGSLLDDNEQTIYSSIYEYEHAGWLPGYHSIARYHRDIDAAVVQFVSTTGGNTELTTNVVYNRIVRILHNSDGD